MDDESPQRRLRAFLSFVPSKYTKSRTRKSASQPQYDESHKKDSRLRRLTQSIRRWRSRRKKSVGSAEEAYRFSKTLSSRRSSEGTLSIHCQGVTTQGFERIDHHIGGLEQENVRAAVEDIARDDTDAQKEGMTPSLVVQTVAVGDDIASRNTDIDVGEDVTSPAENDSVVDEEVLCLTNDRVVENPETIFYGPVPFTTPQCIFIRGREEAKQFADEIMSPSTSTKASGRLVYWTDASLREAKYNQDNQTRGGASVAYQQDGHWEIEYAHVVGLKRSDLMETFAILMALKIALHNCLGAGLIFILSDSETSLRWLANVLSLFPAMDEASREFQATKCYARAVVSFARTFGFSNLDRFPGTHLQAVLWYVLPQHNSLASATAQYEC